MKEHNYAQGVLVQLILAMILFAGLLAWKIDAIRNIYLPEHSSLIAMMVNGFIVLLFLTGVAALLRVYAHYRFEEGQIGLYLRKRATEEANPILSLSPESSLSRRYFKMEELHDKRTAINHDALASLMRTEEALYKSLPRFVNNMLMLIGGFGALATLILALMGASNMLGSQTGGEASSTLISAMNTAMNSTAAAMVCFIFYTYFYYRISDVQNHFFSRIEDIIITCIAPEFSFDSESINRETDALVKELAELLYRLKAITSSIEPVVTELGGHAASQVEWLKALAAKEDAQARKLDLIIHHLEKASRLLIKGFRLENSLELDSSPETEEDNKGRLTGPGRF